MARALSAASVDMQEDGAAPAACTSGKGHSAATGAALPVGTGGDGAVASVDAGDESEATDSAPFAAHPNDTQPDATPRAGPSTAASGPSHCKRKRNAQLRDDQSGHAAAAEQRCDVEQRDSPLVRWPSPDGDIAVCTALARTGMPNIQRCTRLVCPRLDGGLRPQP